MRNRDARIAGFLYLLAIIGGVFALLYVPDKIVVSGDAIATAQNIRVHETLFRLGMAGDIVVGVIWLAVVLALYRLLKNVDQFQAHLLLVLGAYIQVPLYFVNVVNYAAALSLVTGAGYLSVFTDAQRDALAMLFLKLHQYQLLASLMFAGLWLFPFGILVVKSRVLPRILGYWLIVDGFAWIAICLCGFVTPQYSHVVDTVTSPIKFAEVAIMLWLLIFGARRFRRRSDVTPEPTA
ncbi:MAG: DUF4386 domain-containing protein [Candidatus Cybelea sp.]|jgi:hypothetical protein